MLRYKRYKPLCVAIAQMYAYLAWNCANCRVHPSKIAPYL